MNPDQERLNAFQARMNGWVSSQGLMFQLRHGGSVLGAKSPFLASAMGLMVRLGVLAVVGLLGFWIYLAKRVEYDGFREDLEAGVARVLKAESVDVSGVGRQRGFLNLNVMSVAGGEESFFYAAEIRGARTRMGLLDGLLKPWGGGELVMKELRVKVKSGAETDEAAAAAFASLFNEAEGFRFSKLVVDQATVFWGYSKQHRGGIRDAKMVAERTENGWRVVFSGGQFSQNWLKNLDVERFVVEIGKDGITIPEMKFRRGEGTVQGRLEFVAGGSRPQVRGAGSMTGLPIWNALNPEFRRFIDGRISGTFEIDGFMNSQEGIGIKMDVVLEEGDKIELKDRFQLFVVISAADRFRSYKRVRFTNGRFRLETGGGKMRVGDIWLSAPDLMQLEGAFVARPPTKDEVKEFMDHEAGATVGELPDLLMPAADEEESDEFTLKRAAKTDKEDEGMNAAGSIIPGSEFGFKSRQELEEEAVQREQNKQLIGGIRVGLTKDTFSRYPAMDAAYPVGADGMRWLTIPLKGSIFSVGVNEAERLTELRAKGR